MTAELQRDPEVTHSAPTAAPAGPDATGAAPADAAGQPHWRTARLAAYTLYAGVWVWILIADGVPTDRLDIALLIVSGLAITRIGHGWRSLGRVVLDWLPFTLVLMAYDRTRAVADALGMPVHVEDVLHVERWLFGGTEPTLWLQRHLYDAGTIHWYDVACTLVYSSHFLVTPVLAAALWLRRRELWLWFITRVVALSAAGLVTYCLFPQAPPWYAAKEGFSDPVLRLSSRGFIPLHLGDVRSSFETAQRVGANPVAAMPSLHTAFAVMVALTAIVLLRSRWRWAVVLYPMAMGFTLVYTGEHYVIDLIAGTVYAIGVHLAVRTWERRRAARAADVSAAASATHDGSQRPVASSAAKADVAAR